MRIIIIIFLYNMDQTGSKNKTTKSKKTEKSSKDKKTKSSTKSKVKGGNFLGTVGDLVAPTGWGPFATAAGLLALDRADAALRRGTKEKKEKMKGGKKSEKKDVKKMKGGEIMCTKKLEYNSNGKKYTVCCTMNGKTKCETRTYTQTPLGETQIYKMIEDNLKRTLSNNNS